MGVWEVVLRKDMDVEGAPTVTPGWIDMGDRSTPRFVVREIKNAMKKFDVPSAAELFIGKPLVESVQHFSSARGSALATVPTQV